MSVPSRLFCFCDTARRVQRIGGIAAVCLVAMLAIPVSAQAQTPTDLTAGLKFGLNVATIAEEGAPVSSIPRLSLGGYVRRPFDEQVAVQVEALLSGQGGEAYGFTVNLAYLQIPVLGVFTFGEGTAKPFVFAGPSVGLKLSSSMRYEGERMDLPASAGDFSLVFGAGIGGDKFSLDARYMLGLTDVDPESDSSKNRVFSILLGYRFR